MSTPADLEWGAFPEAAPWVLDRGQIGWWAEAGRLRGLAQPAGPEPDHAGSPAARASGRGRRRPARAGRRPVDLAAQARPSARSGGSRRALPARAPRRRGARADLHQARPDHLVRRGPVPARAGRGVQAVPRPGAGRAVRRRARDRRGRPRRPARRACSTRSTRRPLAAASIAQVHAARLRTGEDVVVKVQRPDVARLVHTDLRAMAWLAPHLVGRIPVAALANPPALVELFAETIVEELDFRHRGGQHARHRRRCCATSARTATSCPARTRRWSPGGCS